MKRVRVDAGDMRTRVALYSPTVSQDAGGAQTTTWTDQGDVWARWTPVHGSEVWQSQAAQAIKPVTALIRYKSDLTTAWRLKLGSEYYDIVSIDDIQNRHEYQEMKLVLHVGSVL